ncbi:nicotinamide adenine dinucleotide transporter 1, chloroplastic [Physcomitrium patens]|uniref:Mitochondrial carrier protein n=1 Tax=Physcomitrium patens TaxID=3218 RepID=A9RKW8_PHYPA|nr:nicotinamide adenine dinucleotide transporter 1, chloroplastic-like [Physcomitrium patens]PNR37889.1 hypothetical protein PHYPA_020999 [Physcomitrium patens]|eukprot:XP_024398225.1 nicotinamide adenine dinucleotide transporter 1, chloroplastic-like [Physcomitrella patens]
MAKKTHNSVALAIAREDRRNKFITAAAGAGAGMLAATFVCPLDVVKTRLQVNRMGYENINGMMVLGHLGTIFKKEGVKGLYCGFSSTMVALLVNWAVYFTVYEQLKGMLQAREARKNGGVVGKGGAYAHPPKLSVGANMLASAGAGATTILVTNPLWVVKTRIQTQSLRPDLIPYKGVASALHRIFREEGARGLYSGVVPALAGISHVAIQFPLFEFLKNQLALREGTTVDKLPVGQVAMATSAAKVIASTITYPHEVVRSRLQEQGVARLEKLRYTGVVDCIKKITAHEGIRGFYLGYATNLMRTTPAAVITFTSFEMILRQLKIIFPPRRED